MKVVLSAILLAFVPASGLLYHIDQPVPVSLAHAEYFLSIRLWGEGGAMARFGIGLFDRITLGASYGGNAFIGSGTPQAYRRPEFMARAAILMEQGYMPDFLVGFESQGYDHYDTADGYTVLPRGGYACLGKTIDVSRTYLTLGVSYWNDVSGFVVVNQLLPGDLEFIVEYDLATNDTRDGRGVWPGYLNLGLGWTFSNKMRFCLALRDILGRDEDREPDPYNLNRVIDLSFHNSF